MIVKRGEKRGDMDDDRRIRKNCIAVADGRSDAAVPAAVFRSVPSVALTHATRMPYTSSVSRARRPSARRASRSRAASGSPPFVSPHQMGPHFSESTTDSLYSPVAEKAATGPVTRGRFLKLAMSSGICPTPFSSCSVGPYWRRSPTTAVFVF
jgi:hypothetical protein